LKVVVCADVAVVAFDRQKMALRARSSWRQEYLICNADEGDPGAFMDRAVIEGDPHRLLEGMLLGAYSIGASKAYIYIRANIRWRSNVLNGPSPKPKNGA
jgi:NADH:ubiquinone oxidoreductase subunit F (NADH-binding)